MSKESKIRRLRKSKVLIIHVQDAAHLWFLEMDNMDASMGA